MDCKKKYTCALVGASECNMSELTNRTYDTYIAVDGGYAHLQEAHITPDLALGDFDSLGFVPDTVACEVHPVAKDASDLALALRRAAERGATHIDVFGALGGRPDHTFATYQALAGAAASGIVVRAFGCDGGVVVLHAPEKGSLCKELTVLTLPAIAGETFSVFACTDVCTHVTIKGFRYELIDGELTNDTPLGLSNVTLETPGTISLEQGTLMVFLPEVLMRALA